MQMLFFVKFNKEWNGTDEEVVQVTAKENHDKMLGKCWIHFRRLMNFKKLGIRPD